MEDGDPAETYQAVCRARRVNPIVLWLGVCLVLAVLLSRTELRPRLLQSMELARTPPTSPTKYSLQDARRMAVIEMRRREPGTTEWQVTTTGPWTEFHGVTRGRPVYFSSVFGNVRRAGALVVETPLLLMDATTGKFLKPQRGE